MGWKIDNVQSSLPFRIKNGTIFMKAYHREYVGTITTPYDFEEDRTSFNYDWLAYALQGDKELVIHRDLSYNVRDVNTKLLLDVGVVSVPELTLYADYREVGYGRRGPSVIPILYDDMRDLMFLCADKNLRALEVYKPKINLKGSFSLDSSYLLALRNITEDVNPKYIIYNQRQLKEGVDFVEICRDI